MIKQGTCRGFMSEPLTTGRSHEGGGGGRWSRWNCNRKGHRPWPLEVLVGQGRAGRRGGAEVLGERVGWNALITQADMRSFARFL